MSATNEKTKKSLWGKGIFIFYGAFVAFMLAIVIYAAMQDFHLVERDYYQKEIEYQSQIDAINNANKLLEKPEWVINHAEKVLTFKFPESIMDNIVSGEVLLYNPSGSSRDVSVNIEPDQSGLQLVSTKSLSRGLWKLKMSWEDDLQDYYLEDKFMIQ